MRTPSAVGVGVVGAGPRLAHAARPLLAAARGPFPARDHPLLLLLWPHKGDRRAKRPGLVPLFRTALPTGVRGGRLVSGASWRRSPESGGFDYPTPRP